MNYPFSFISLLLICSDMNVLACNCDIDIAEMNIARYNETTAIFVAAVDSSSPCRDHSTVYFKIIKTYKGNLPSSLAVEEIDCKTPCALNFEKGKQYLIYAYSTPENEIKIIPCKSSRRILNHNEIEDELRNSERFNTRSYVEAEVKLWSEEIAFLEKIYQQTSGEVKTTYPNGNPTGKGKFRNGLPEGDWTYYYPDGSIQGTGQYKKGKKTGSWIEFNPYYESSKDSNNEQIKKRYIIKYSGHYNDGHKDGKWQKINLDGSSEKLFYKKGKFSGEKE
jgi:hypothetical protein